MSTENPTATPQSKNPPLYTHWKNGVFAKTWRNTNREGDIFYNTKVGKIYTDPKTNQIRETKSLSQGDLAKMRFVIDQAENTIKHMQNLQVEQEHTQPPIVKDHSVDHQTGLQAQRDAALANATPHQGNGAVDPNPKQIHAPEM